MIFVIVMRKTQDKDKFEKIKPFFQPIAYAKLIRNWDVNYIMKYTLYKIPRKEFEYYLLNIIFCPIWNENGKFWKN